jgi:LPXTG-site transpeptidase (sortase) family protein
MNTSEPIYISENGVRTFLQEAPRPWRGAGKLVAAAAGITFSIAAVFVLLNLSAFMRVHDTEVIAASQQADVAAPSPSPVTTTVNSGNPSATPAPTAAASVPAVRPIPDTIISYPDLGISAPVIYDVPFDEKTIQNDLFHGVVHIAGTADPGTHGNAVIFGHSSYYPFVHNDYRDVFAPLLKAQVGQEFELSYKTKVYLYQVTSVKEVSPTDIEIMNAHPGEDGATIVTCSPVGTSTNRYVVYGKQISPDPATNEAFTQVNFSGTVPAGQ